MSYANTVSGIQELSFDETEAVQGAVVPAVILAWKVGGFVGGIVIALAIDYYADGELG